MFLCLPGFNFIAHSCVNAPLLEWLKYRDVISVRIPGSAKKVALEFFEQSFMITKPRKVRLNPHRIIVTMTWLLWMPLPIWWGSRYTYRMILHFCVRSTREWESGSFIQVLRNARTQLEQAVHGNYVTFSFILSNRNYQRVEFKPAASFCDLFLSY